MSSYKVAPGRSILVKGSVRKAMKAGDVVPADAPGLKEWLASGFVVLEGASEAPKPATGEPVSPWNLDPAVLRRKSLELLNIMVKERDPSLAPFTSKEEAIKKLASGYKAS